MGLSPAEIRDTIASTHLLDVWDFDWTRQAIFGADKIRARLREFVGDKQFADLPIPITLIAADLASGREVHLNAGPLDEALLATMAIPGVFHPARRDGMVLVDGGILNPLPVDVARRLGPRRVAVDVATHRVPGESTQLFEARGPMGYATEVARRLGLTEPAEAMYQAACVAADRLIEHSLAAYPPDTLLRPAVGHVGLFAFDLAEEAYRRGQDAAWAALPRLEALARSRIPTLAAWHRDRSQPVVGGLAKGQHVPRMEAERT